MKFEIPFDTETNRVQTQLIFKTTWKKKLRETKRNIVYGILMLVFGVLILFLNNNLGYIFLAMSAFYALNIVNVYAYYRKSKKEFSKLMQSFSDELSKSDKGTIWHFQDDHLYYKDALVEGKINWNILKRYELIEDHLLLNINYGIPAVYILGKEEIGEESFKEVVNFVKDRIEKNQIAMSKTPE